jgi:hypothetical protein
VVGRLLHIQTPVNTIHFISLSTTVPLTYNPSVVR